MDRKATVPGRLLATGAKSKLANIRRSRAVSTHESRNLALGARFGRSGRRLALTATAVLVAAALQLGAPVDAAFAGNIDTVSAIEAPAAVLPGSFAPIVESVAPAVVAVSTTVHDGSDTRAEMPQMPEFNFPEGSPFEQFFHDFLERQFPGGIPRETPDEAPDLHAVGSGFIIDPQGFVVTNNHVIENADEITVILSDGSRYPAETKGRDPKTDIALLKINTAQPLPYLTFGDSRNAKVGDWVVAVGNPFGLGGTVTAGIISARGRDIGSGPYDDFLQVDAPINRGNSGGPLFDTNGKVIGVNTAIFSPSGGNIGIGFAIPSETVQSVVAELRAHGRVERGWLGLHIQELTDEIAQSLGLDSSRGALIADVTPDGPAAKAGLQPGDVVLEFDGHAVETIRDLPRMVAAAKAEHHSKLVVWRDKTHITVDVTIGRLADETTASAEIPGTKSHAASSLGLSLAPLSSETRKQFGIGAEVKGALVVDVARGGPADKQGIRRGDVIKRVGKTEVTQPEDVVREVKRTAATKERGVLLLVERDGLSRFVAIPLA